jgi:hypothetical protein
MKCDRVVNSQQKMAVMTAMRGTCVCMMVFWGIRGFEGSGNLGV